LPTGKSRTESEIAGLDSRGNGFWAAGAGVLLTKIIARWDGFVSVDAHRSFAKSVDNSSLHARLEPGFGGNWGFGGGYNWRFLRVGTSLIWTYEDPIKIKGSLDSEGSLERYATGVVALSYIPSNEWSAALSYSDQTLFGSPLNTSLGKTVALQVQRRWSR
jgi:hypothetical protein